MIGTTFAGFTVLERINHGGMADIYLVADSRDQRFILRVMLPEFRSDRKRLRQFEWGCQVVAKLDHPNIVKFFGSGEFLDTLFAIFEFVDGSNLRERLLRADPLLKTHRQRLLLGMAAGLAHIHDRGFLHLDFKPENVLVPRSYDPKIVDFDLAMKRPDEPERHLITSGTPAYWSPEQIARQPFDERADVFAFGITAYEVVTGKKPVSGNSREELLEKYMRFDEHLVPPRQRAPDCPRALERVILKCLEKDISRRYPSMSLVVRDLRS
jgi:serine/threonine-protein kinase